MRSTASGVVAAAVAAMRAETAAEGLTLAVAVTPWAEAALLWAVAAMLWPRACTSAAGLPALTLADGVPTRVGLLQPLTMALPGTPTAGGISRPRATASPMRVQARTPRIRDMWRVRALSATRGPYPRIRACTLA